MLRKKYLYNSILLSTSNLINSTRFLMKYIDIIIIIFYQQTKTIYALSSGATDSKGSEQNMRTGKTGYETPFSHTRPPNSPLTLYTFIVSTVYSVFPFLLTKPATAVFSKSVRLLATWYYFWPHNFPVLWLRFCCCVWVTASTLPSDNQRKSFILIYYHLLFC